MKISVIIPTLSRDRYLEDTIEDLLNQDNDYSFEIIIIDQNNLPLEERSQSLKLLVQEKEIKWIRFSGKNVVLSRNKGIDIAKGDIIVFLDDDIRIKDKNFLNKHIQAYGDASENIAAVCGREVNPGGAEFSYNFNYARNNPISDILFFPRNYFKRVREKGVTPN